MQVEICGYAVEIDDDCEAIVRAHHWAIYDSRTTPDHPYAWTTIDNKMVSLHRLIMGNPSSHVDHRDGNTLNNRRSNLRLCSRSQNKANSKRYRNNTSGYKGVSPTRSRRNPWQAIIYHERKQFHLGLFKTAEAAHEAYKAAAMRIYGEFARFE